MPLLGLLLSLYWWVCPTYSLITTTVPHSQMNQLHWCNPKEVFAWLPFQSRGFKTDAYWPLSVFFSLHSHMHIWAYGTVHTPECPWQDDDLSTLIEFWKCQPGKTKISPSRREFPSSSTWLHWILAQQLNLSSCVLLKVWLTVPSVLKAKKNKLFRHKYVTHSGQHTQNNLSFDFAKRIFMTK